MVTDCLLHVYMHYRICYHHWQQHNYMVHSCLFAQESQPLGRLYQTIIALFPAQFSPPFVMWQEEGICWCVTSKTLALQLARLSEHVDIVNIIIVAVNRVQMSLLLQSHEYPKTGSNMYCTGSYEWCHQTHLNFGNAAAISYFVQQSSVEMSCFSHYSQDFTKHSAFKEL